MNNKKTIFGAFLMLALLIMPFYPIWSEVAVALLFVVGVCLKSQDAKIDFHNPVAILSGLILMLFAVSAISLTTSSDFFVGLKNLHTYIPFAVLPILYFLYDKYLTNNNLKLLKAVSAGVLLASAVCLILAVVRSFYLVNGHLVFNPYISYRNQFVYTYLSVFQYTNTFAMMAVFVVAVLVWVLMYGNEVKRKWLIYSSIGLCLLMVFLLSSRTNVYALFAVLYFSVFVFYFRFKRLIHSILLFVAVTGLFWVFQTCNYRVMNLSQKVASYITEEDIQMENGYVIKHPEKVEDVNIRFQMWETGLKIVRNNWMTGCGIGDYKSLLRSRYQSDGLTEAYEKCYDQHNQYIETIGTLGILGFAILISIMAFALYLSWKSRNYLLFCCLMILALNMLLESMFNRYSGSLFFVVSLMLSAMAGQKNGKIPFC